MAGKVSGASSKGGGGGNVRNAFQAKSVASPAGSSGIPTRGWEDRNLAPPPEMGGPTYAGKIQHEALEKSRDGKGIMKKM